MDAFSPLGPCWEVWGLLKLLWWLCTAYRKKFIFFGLAFSTPTPATSPPLFLWLLVLQKVSSYFYFLDTGSMFSARVSAHTFLPEIFSSHHHAVQPYPSFNTRIDLGSCLSHTTACSNPTQSHWPVLMALPPKQMLAGNWSPGLHPCLVPQFLPDELEQLPL